MEGGALPTIAPSLVSLPRMGVLRIAVGRTGSEDHGCPACAQDTAAPAICLMDVPSRPFVLVVCAGPAWTGDMAAASREVGVPVLLVDPLRGGADHDITRAMVEAALVDLCRRPISATAPCVLAAHFAPPCRSFSPLNKWRGLRTRDDPDGVDAPLGYRQYIHTENAIIRVVMRLAEILLRSDRPVTIENPPDLAEAGRPWYWPAMRENACLWVMEPVRSLRDAFGMLTATAPMCAFGSTYLKYFTILASHNVRVDLEWMATLSCSGAGRHAEHTPARGRDSSGVSHASAAGRYPRRLNTWLLRALSRAAAGPSGAGMPSPRSSWSGSDSDREAGSSDDCAGAGRSEADAEASRVPLARPRPDRSRSAGSILAGPELDPLVRAEVEEQRSIPADFASFRNRRQASDAELDRTELPDVRAMARRLAEEASVEPPPAGSTPTFIQWDGEGDWRSLVSGAPAGRVTLRSLVGDAALADWQEYMHKTQAAFDEVRVGRHPSSPGDFVLRASALPSWARCFVWDTEDPADCVPVRRSDRHTTFPGPKQLDRSKFRHIARILDWRNVDPDIVRQVGEGGAEFRTRAPLHTTASWHHPGVVQNFEQADEAVRKERDNSWTRVSASPLPFVPCVFSPRDVVLQERARLVGGKLEFYLKPRVTHDMSSLPRELGGRKAGVSTNSGVPRSQKGIPVMPRAQEYARAQAVCARAMAGSALRAPRAGVYGVDKASAYCFSQVQRADHYTGCYLWLDSDGRVRPHVSMRMVFGGASWPNRFERISLLDSAWVQRCQREFDEVNPLPVEACRWVAMRQNLQRRRVLPDGVAQVRPAGMEPYIDDLSGRALLDDVVMPDHLRGIDIGAAQTEAIGCRAAPESSRLAAHCKIAVYQLTWLGWEIPAEKTMCGDGMILLGVFLDALHQCVRCPQLKREWVVYAVDQVRTHLRDSGRVNVDLMQRFTGRLTNLSQYFPELRPPLSVGYSLSRGKWARTLRRDRDGVRWLRIGKRSRTHSELLDLLDVALDTATDNSGVALAPARQFDEMLVESTLTVVTDASRADSDDGFGGYAFAPAAPGVVFLMSAAWPSDVKAAIDAASATRAVRAEIARDAGGMLSMPAGEVFAALALAQAVRAHLGGGFEAVIAVGDCAPAARAISRRYSRSPQMRALVGACVSSAPRWLGVQVPREWNVDADRLSHPSMFDLVSREVAAGGWEVCRLDTPAGLFDLLAEVTRLPLGRDDEPWNESSR